MADRIAGEVIIRPDGTAQWLGLTQDGAGGAMIVAPAGLGLYDGAPGLALFLAAAARVLGDDHLADLARRAVRPVCESLLGHHGRLVASGLGAGYARGLGGLLPALAWMHDLLDDRRLLDAAVGIAGLAAAAAEHDRAHDVLGGAAGLVLGLIVLHDRTGDPTLLTAAIDAGSRMLAAAGRRGDALCWAMKGGPPLTGLSHGAAGFALALAALYRATGNRDWCRAAEAALAYERTLFVAEAGNWPDLRPRSDDQGTDADPPRFVAAWCHGAPGIALGRLGLLSALDGADGRLEAGLRRDLEVALATTCRHAIQNTDDLCCGNAGRLDILATAGRSLGRADWTAAAQDGLAHRLAHFHHQGQCHLWHHDLPVVPGDPGLFKGTAGFCYLLARMIAPELVPNVLLPTPRGT